MKAMNSKKGFTLIELLIVIAIIGVLAVAFLPSLLGAPAKGRDTSRIADLQKIQKVLINANLEAKAYPVAAAGTCVDGTVAPFNDVKYLSAFGGKTPSDPVPTSIVGAVAGCDGKYYYKSNPSGGVGPASGTFSFGLYAHVENFATANAVCADALVGKITAPAAGAAADTLCYAILTQ